MRPAHLVDSSVSGTSRQELSGRKFSAMKCGCQYVRFLFSVRRLQHQCQETPNQVKPVFHAAILMTTFFLAGCEWFGPAERYKSESGRTTFRAGDESPTTRPEVTPAPQKIPG